MAPHHEHILTKTDNCAWALVLDLLAPAELGEVAYHVGIHTLVDHEQIGLHMLHWPRGLKGALGRPS